MGTWKWFCVMELLYFFLLFAYARNSKVKTIPEGPIFEEGELITYVQKFDAFPHDKLMRFSHLKINESDASSTACLYHQKCIMYHQHLFDVPLLKRIGKKSVGTELGDLAGQYFDITVERQNSVHIISLKINLTCHAARGLHTKVIVKDPLQQTQKETELSHYGFIAMKIRDFKTQKENVTINVGDAILGTCEIEQCFSHKLNKQLDGSRTLYMVEEGDLESDLIHSVSSIVESLDSDVYRRLFKETATFVAHCSKMVLSCRGSVGKNSAAPSQSITVDNVDKQFCKSAEIEFFLLRPNRSRTSDFTDIEEDESWQVVCKAVVENSFDSPRLSGPLDNEIQIDSMEIPLNKMYMVVARVDIVLKDCSVFGEEVQCALDQGEAYKIPILPKVCSTQILSISAEIYNTVSLKRTNYSARMELRSNEELIITCHILIPKMVGFRGANITDANDQPLKVHTSCKDDSLKRYLVTLEAIVSRKTLDTNEMHKYTCTVDHAWAESEISLETSPLFILKRTTRWYKAGLLLMSVVLIIIILCCLLDCFNTRLVYTVHSVYQRAFWNRYDMSRKESFMKMYEEEETVFERATDCTHLLKEY